MAVKSPIPTPSMLSFLQAPPAASNKVRPKRGDIWFVKDESRDPHLGRHVGVGSEIWSNKLAVVVSNNRMNDTSELVQIVYASLSSARESNLLHPSISVPATGGHSESAEGIIFCEQIHTVDQSRLWTYRGRVDAEKLREIENAIAWTLGINLPATNS